MANNNVKDKRNGNRKFKSKTFRNNDSKCENTTYAKGSNTPQDITANDPMWYSSSAALLRDSASLPFSYPFGAPVESGIDTLYVTIPGICALEVAPTVGYSDRPNSPINIAANNLYTFVRHANSGSRNYDAPNLMMYVTAVADLYGYVNFLTRVYGISMLYSQRNLYIHDALMRAMYVNPDSIRSNLANFRYGINVLINKVSSFAVPANIPYFRRKAFLYSGVYKEGMSVKDQLYLFVPSGFFQYMDPGILTFRPFRDGTLTVNAAAPEKHDIKWKSSESDDGLMTVNQLLRYGTALFDTLAGSEDMGVMNGDIMKAYGVENLLKLAEVPENYTIDFVFDINVLEQMKNAVVLPMTYGESNTVGSPRIFHRDDFASKTDVEFKQAVYEDATNVLMGPILKSYPMVSNKAQYLGNKWITTQADVATPEIIIENSRLIPGVTATSSSLAVLSTMTEVVTRVLYYQLNPSGDLRYTKQADSFYTTETNAIDTARLSAFKYRPFAMFYIKKDSSVFMELWTNMDNYTVMSNAEAGRLNETALLSLLNVPNVGKLS